MDLVLRYLEGVGVLFAESAPYLLVGFLLAGLFQVFVPKPAITRQLGRDDLRSVLWASLWGLPLPLCSCSVLPTAAALRRSGASRGATAAFLISTPETGVDSISVTYALFGPVMAVVRPVAAFFSALATGALVTWVTKGEDGTPEELEHAGHGHPDELRLEDASEPRQLSLRLRAAVGYGFGALLDDLTPYFIVGFLLSGVIAVAVPETLFGSVVPHGWVSMALMILVGTPLYICATASTPIAAALVAKGLDPGAALVFLLVGPATNVTTVLVVWRLLGRRNVALYVIASIGVAVAAGFGVNVLFRRLGIDLPAQVGAELHAGPGPVALAAGAVFALLLLRSAVRIRLWRRLWRSF